MKTELNDGVKIEALDLVIKEFNWLWGCEISLIFIQLTVRHCICSSYNVYEAIDYIGLSVTIIKGATASSFSPSASDGGMISIMLTGLVPIDLKAQLEKQELAIRAERNFIWICKWVYSYKDERVKSKTNRFCN